MIPLSDITIHTGFWTGFVIGFFVGVVVIWAVAIWFSGKDNGD